MQENNNNNNNNMNHIQATINLVIACGPVRKGQIAAEIRVQVSDATAENSVSLAQSAIEHGLSRGWIEVYDPYAKGDDVSYVMA